MKQQFETLLTSLKNGETPFAKVLEFIDANYNHQPTAFKNGNTYNDANQNQGSARVFAFAQLNQLNADNTLYLFAEHYKAVLDTPEGTDHQNIRQFMANGWNGIAFEGQALKVK